MLNVHSIPLETRVARKLASCLNSFVEGKEILRDAQQPRQKRKTMDMSYKSNKKKCSDSYKSNKIKSNEAKLNLN